MKMKLLVVSLFIVSVVLARPKPTMTDQYVLCLKKVTDVMVNDVASPVAASRYYAYVSLAAYEAAALYTELPPFKGVLKDYNGVVISKELVQGTDKNIAVLMAVMKTGERLLPSGYMVKTSTDSLVTLFVKNPALKKTMVLVDSLVVQIMKYVAGDGFNKLNNRPRYILRNGDGYWKPTPPAFMAPVEPHWNSLRTFYLDSAQQFKPAPPAGYDTAKGSAFYKMMMEVYEVDKEKDPAKQEIANFWDCNPFAVQQIGHVEFGLKKISPGGHWVGITGIVCRQRKFSLEQTVVAHALVSIGLADAFISCWDEKYRSNRVRPEHVIQKLIDPAWRPLLQTPPFPEYVSGHSVASTAASVILASIFGDATVFNDDTETEFGLKPRKFTSFSAAAAEASVSRLYGGIHYRDAIDQGIWQGRQIGQLMIAKMPAHIEAIRKIR
ncbi:MAG TPA: vanadium-dependent haloperoxidase [Chitinophagaceae bacterium]|nr:vanadium-dependent haloperoxidase [Chitinophagaceae bacterium]